MDRIKELEQLIPQYATKYYTGESEITDEEFDSLVEELRSLSPDSSVLTTGWGFTPDSSKKKNHLYGLHISGLPKVKSVESIPSDLRDSSDVRLSVKLDGLSIVSYYKNGERVLSLTRGNGSVGIDVTDKINMISPETKVLNTEFSGAVRGEVLITNETWSRISVEYANDPSKNQRNLASGILNRNDCTPDLELLDYIVYKILYDEDINPNHYENSKVMTEYLNYLGFKFNNDHYVMKNKDSITDEYLKELYDDFCKRFPCDGIVLTKVNEDLEYNEVAYKFQAEIKEVEVTDVTYDLSRTGRMVPRIWFKPTELSGAMVQKCTGFNAQYIRDSKINKGSVIKVCRSGEVIPYIVEVVTPSDKGLVPIEYLGTKLEWKGVDLIVPDYDGQSAYHYIRTVAPVDGAGWSLYSRICDIAELSDNFSLLNFLTTLYYDRSIVQEVLLSRISGSVTQSKVKLILDDLLKPVDSVRFLAACNIHGVSWTTADTILNEYPEFINDIKEGKINYNRLESVKGVGYSTTLKIKDRIPFIEDLLKIVKVNEFKKREVEEFKFKVAITGSLSMKRAEFVKKMNENHICESSNLKECKYLVTNNPDSGSSKMNNAKKYGVEVISEEDFTRTYLG